MKNPRMRPFFVQSQLATPEVPGSRKNPTRFGSSSEDVKKQRS